MVVVRLLLQFWLLNFLLVGDIMGEFIDFFFGMLSDIVDFWNSLTISIWGFNVSLFSIAFALFIVCLVISAFYRGTKT